MSAEAPATVAHAAALSHLHPTALQRDFLQRPHIVSPPTADCQPLAIDFFFRSGDMALDLPRCSCRLCTWGVQCSAGRD